MRPLTLPTRALGAGLALALLAGPALLAGCQGSNPALPQVRPVEGGWVSSGFGARPIHPIKGPVPGGHHDGYDFAVAAGQPIRASMSGTVRSAGWLGGYGNAVVLQHPDGYTTLYGHASALKVKPGQHVAAGELIALVGSTGLSTGPHLHYELRKNGLAIDPGGFQEGPLALAAADRPLSTRLAVRKLKHGQLAKASAAARLKAAKQVPKRTRKPAAKTPGHAAGVGHR